MIRSTRQAQPLTRANEAILVSHDVVQRSFQVPISELSPVADSRHGGDFGIKSFALMFELFQGGPP